MRAAGGVIGAVLAWLLALGLAHAAAPQRGLYEASSPAPGDDLRYFLIMDAGSTGTRIHVFAYRPAAPSSVGGLPEIKPSLSTKIKPGLSSFHQSPGDAGASLKQLLDFAKLNVPLSHWRSTPVYLKATAGLRSVSAGSALEILDSCRAFIASYPFLFRPEWAQIISGSEEGIFGWLAVNYLEGALASGRPEDTVGVLEIGGASMQITFVPRELPPAEVSMPGIHHVEVAARRFLVYTHSYLNYGMEAAQRQLTGMFESQFRQEGHPCYLREFTTPDGLRGVGDHAKCSLAMEALFGKKECPATCSFDGVYQPTITSERFYAIENFYYTTEFFECANNKDPFTALSRKSREFCGMEWPEAPKLYRNEPLDDLYKYCFSSIYLEKVLFRAFGIRDPDRQTSVIRDINGVKIDWALGAVLHELARGEGSRRAAEPEYGHASGVDPRRAGVDMSATPSGVVPRLDGGPPELASSDLERSSFAFMSLGVIVVVLMFGVIVGRRWLSPRGLNRVRSAVRLDKAQAV